MEVFFHGLQQGCSEKRLKQYLTQVFAPFNIAPEGFQCEKRRKAAVATATILDIAKAEAFLAMYGGRRGALFLDKAFMCILSSKQPDKYDLKSLEKTFKDGSKKKPSLTQGPLEHKTYWAESIACGLWKHNKDDLTFIPQYVSQRPIQLLFGKKELVLLMQAIAGNDLTYRRVSIEYSTIYSMATCQNHSYMLTFTLDRSPKFYRSPDVHEQLAAVSLNKHAANDPKRVRTRALDAKHARFGESCFVYQVAVVPTHLSMLKKLLAKTKSLPGLVNRPFKIQPELLMFDEAVSSLHKNLIASKLSFAIKFQLQMLAQNAILLPDVVESLIPILAKTEKESGMEKSVQYLQQLGRVLPFPGPEADGEMFDFEFLKNYLTLPSSDNAGEEDELSAFQLARRHPHLVIVHRARVTPAGIYLHGPYAEAQNGVLERYRSHALDSFLRVSFEDENGEALKYEPQADLTEVHGHRFKGVLNNAITIAGRKFEFLGFSHSSLRESSCWFLAPFFFEESLMFAPRLISQLGDFTQIRSPAKCGARIGQAFTDLNDNVFIPNSAIVEIPDVERNGRCFSDGCSTASLEVFEKLWKRIHPNSFKPTTFQIRYGGVKGVISLDRSLQGLVIKVRPSQRKFPSTSEMLGICGAARRTLSLYLNRPMIKILEDLGVGTTTLLHFQNQAIQGLRVVTASAYSAATFAEIHEIGGAANLPWLIKELEYLGLSPLKDHFLWGAIELVIILRLRDIKYKGRIPISPEGGATLFGIMDETNTLKPGTIYCTINEGEVVTGAVSVTRSPAMHPGDIQKAVAVDVPKGHPLKDLHNVVVFSQQGERDLPSMLSGGDLDGDLFNVIIDPKLQPTEYFKPADYPRVDPIDLGRPVTAKDISGFFVDFMSNDVLGQIATRHLQLAEQAHLGTRDLGCIQLSSMHSTAVDFSKTGIPVRMTAGPRLNSKCKPDFMANGPRMLIEKGVPALEINPDTGFYNEDEDDILNELEDFIPTLKYYESEKALGHLYRGIDEAKFLADLQSGQRNGTATSECVLPKLWKYVQQKTLIYQWEHLKPWAKNIMDQYYNSVVDMMHQYALDPHHPLTETEVFLGIVMGKNGGVPSKRARDAASSIREQFSDLVHYNVECILKGQDENFDEEALGRCLACFAVSLDEADESQFDKKIGKLQSFGYLAATLCLRQVQRFVKDGF